MAVIALKRANETQGEASARLQFVHPGNAILRRAIRENIVSFPSQIPALSRQALPDMQCRAVMLYFVRGWTMAEVGERYGLAVFRVHQIINEWAVRAFALGYIQVIDDARFSQLAGNAVEEAGEAHVHNTTGPVPVVLSPCAAELTALRIRIEERQAEFASAPPDNVAALLNQAAEGFRNRTGEFWIYVTAALCSLRAAVESAESLRSSHLLTAAAGDARHSLQEVVCRRESSSPLAPSSP
jgi:hypothetical protein